MTARDDIRADVERWPDDLRAAWQEVVETNNFAEWAKYPKAEVELRAWLDARAGAFQGGDDRRELAREPVVLNRHWFTPSTPQPTGKAWPASAVYIGRPPTTAPALTARGGDAWRYSHLLQNKYPKDLYPDGLQRFRLELRAAMRVDKVKPHPVVDAIRSLGPAAALVCSCAQTPFTPEIAVPADAPLPKSVCCHGHLLIMAWRALNGRRPAGIGNNHVEAPPPAAA